MAHAPEHPFHQAAPPDRERLLAYLEGRLNDAERHAVEAAVESDPLVREAFEGLETPGALDTLRTLDASRPAPGRRGGHSLWWWVLGAALVALVKFHALAPGPSPASDASGDLHAGAYSMEEHDVPAITLHAIEASVEQPESLRIGHRPDERHALAARVEEPTVDRTPPPDRLAPQRPTPAADAARSPRRTRPSLQLHYLHELKIVHPSELYPPEFPDLDEEPNVAARYQDRSAQRSGTEPQRHVAYLPFMDEALGRFVRNDHKGALEELMFLLDQYPNDVNALFYGGLCAYNLGLYEGAERLLRRAAGHPVAVFDEEAAWYHALTLERLGRSEEAREALVRIAAGGGFYAGRAAERR
jgi:tetratricopeptide (TPR) repeat protein